MDLKTRETVSCCVPSCSNTLENCKNASFYSFPKERTLKEQWITALRHRDMYSEIIRDQGPRAISRMFVCSNHFKLDDFKSIADEDINLKGIKAEDALVKRSLRDAAVPSLFPDSNTVLKFPKSSISISTSTSIKRKNKPKKNMKMDFNAIAAKVTQSVGLVKLSSTTTTTPKTAANKKNRADHLGGQSQSPCAVVEVKKSTRMKSVPKKNKMNQTAVQLPSCAANVKVEESTSQETKVVPVTEDTKEKSEAATATLTVHGLKVNVKTPKNKLRTSTSTPSSSTRCSSRIRAPVVPFQVPITKKPKQLLYKPNNTLENNTTAVPPENSTVVIKIERVQSEEMEVDVKPEVELVPSSSSSPPKRKIILKRKSLTGRTRNKRRKSFLSHTKKRKSMISQSQTGESRRKTKSDISNSSKSDSIIAAALSRLSQVPIEKNRPTNRLRTNFGSSNGTGRGEDGYEDEQPINFDDGGGGGAEPVNFVQDSVRMDKRHRRRHSQNNHRPSKSKKAVGSKRVAKSLPSEKASLDPLMPGRIPQDYRPERKETGFIESMFSSAITKVFASPRLTARPGRKRKSDKIGNEDDEEDNKDFIHGDVDPNDEYDFYDYEENGDYLVDENHVPPHIVKLDAIDVNDDNEDDYATPLLNGFGIVTDDHHEPIPSSIVEVKTEELAHFYENSSKMESDCPVDVDPDPESEDFEILPDVETEMLEDEDEIITVEPQPKPEVKFSGAVELENLAREENGEDFNFSI